MKIKYILLNISVLYVVFCTAFAQTLTINEVLNAMHKDSLKRTVQELQDFNSRLCTKTVGQNRQVAQYLVERLKKYGIKNAHIDSFYVSGTHWLVGEYAQYMYNVKGRLSGTGNTDSTVIIGAHLDAIAYTKPDYLPTEFVPGADDNATGCALMIEMARIFHKFNITPSANIDFMAYDAEEIGLLGSYYDAKKRKANNENIIVMLNNDMVGNQPDDKVWEVSLRWYDNSLDVTEKTEQALRYFTKVKPVRADSPNSTGSDSYPYFVENYKVNFAIEQNFSPYYHSANDLTEFLNFAYFREMAKMNFVLLDYYAGVRLPLNIKSDSERDLQSIEVFPNPASEVIRIHNNNGISVSKIDIFDLSGKCLYALQTTEQNQNIMNIAHLSSGIYFLRIHTDIGIVNKKIIKK